jgi:hypothetical protein
VRLSLRQLLRLALCICVLADTVVDAQTETPPPPETPAVSPLAAGVREVKPETYVVRDKDGRLVPMPNLSYEDFRQYVERELQSEDSATGLPAYTLQELRITGTAGSTQADLRVTVSIRPQRDGWVRVPLRFGDAILRAPASYSGQGQAFVDAAEDEAGYNCWVHGPQDQPHDITLDLAVPLRRLGNQRRLALQVPRATSSEMDLRIPVPNVQATVSSGLLKVESDDASTQFHVDGLAPDFQISWADGSAAPVESRPLLQAEIKTLIKVDGVREVTGEIDISISSLRGTFDTFTVRLPVGTTLIPRPSPSGQYLVSDLGIQDEAQGPRVQVKFERRVSGPVNVQLLTTLSAVTNGKTPEYNAGGIEVENAVRQAHVMDFFVDGDLSISWRPGPNVQRTIVPDEAKGTIAARFESYRRSNTLHFQVAPQEAQVSVEPVYVLDVEPSRIRLTATLHYTIRRTNTYGVNVYLPNWRIDQILPEALVDSASLERDKREPLYIPLKPSAIQENGEFTLQIEAVQEIADDARSLSVSLPRPEATLLSAATVVVLPADNIALTVADDRLQGLERESSPPEISVPKRQQSPLYFRERSDASSAVFAAEFRQRRRSVSVAPGCRVEATEQGLGVRQTFDYRIAYEPLRNLEFLVPRALLDGAGLRFLDEQQALPFIEVEDQSLEQTGSAADSGGSAEAPADTSPDDERVRVQVDLLSERIGACAIAVEHQDEMPDLEGDVQTRFRLPLIVPVRADDTTGLAFRLELVADEGLHLEVADDGWEIEPSDQESVTLSTRTLPGDVALVLDKTPTGTHLTTAIRQVWVQSWLEPTRRRDRAVYRIATRNPQVTIQLPAGARFQCAALDGRLVEPAVLEDQRVEIAMGDDGAAEDRVLELWYELAGSQFTTGRVSLQPPTVPGTTRTNRWYWSLATPATDHVLFLPERFTPEMIWQRQGLLWRRQPRLQQGELEQWIGASRQADVPANLNHYLFGSFGDVGELRCTLGARSTVVLFVSGLTLAIGLLLIHVRRCRHPAWLFGLGLSVATVTLLYPDLSMAAFQASLLGLGLVLAAVVMKSVVDWRQSRRGVVRGAVFASPDSKTVKASPSLDARLSDTPATTASLPAQLPAGEASA